MREGGREGEREKRFRRCLFFAHLAPPHPPAPLASEARGGQGGQLHAPGTEPVHIHNLYNWAPASLGSGGWRGRSQCRPRGNPAGPYGGTPRARWELAYRSDPCRSSVLEGSFVFFSFCVRSLLYLLAPSRSPLSDAALSPFPPPSAPPHSLRQGSRSGSFPRRLRLVSRGA